MNSFLSILWKEIIHIKRERRIAVIVFTFPLIMTILYGYAISFEPKNVPTGLLDFDNSTKSRELILSLSSSKYFIIHRVSSTDEIYRRIIQGEIKCGIVIPPDFSRKEKMASIQVIIDGSDPNLGKGILKNIQSFFIPSQVNTRFLFNQRMVSSNFYVPGIIVVLITIIGVRITSHSIVKEKEQGTFELLSTTPVSSTSLILGKILPYAIISLIDVFLITGFARLIFSIPVRGSLLSLFLNTSLFLLPTLSIGVTISALSKTELTALFASFIIITLPSILLSGFVFPVENMPGWLQIVTQFLPATHFLKIVRGLFLKGINFFPAEGFTLLGLGILYASIAIVSSGKRVK
ncbi:MAG TPA: ABC transporter permease [candidate division WOR-3 bacterium]|uniref:Transport permease protein n=1 Tax=candidate division WOR-3 bacterium TaxID=2052148 RepID=A0A7C0VAQ8_UNCW3|nr:ABC transporter permease [candidate division WOR-3 bacterium]